MKFARLASTLAGLVAMAACSGAPLPERSVRAPVHERMAADLLPCDLDFVVRLDWQRLSAVPLQKDLIRALIDRAGTTSLTFVAPLLGRTRSLLWGTRLSRDGFHGDGLLVASGDFRDWAPDPTDSAGAPRWARLASSADGYALFVNSIQGSSDGGPSVPDSSARSRPVLLAKVREGAERAEGGDGWALALASSAEADALERVVRQGGDRDRLDPPALGLLSFAGRGRWMSSWQIASANGLLRQVTDGLTRISGSADVEGGIDLEMSLSYDEEPRAKAAFETLRAALDAFRKAPQGSPALRSSVEGTRLTPLGTSVRVQVSVPVELAAAALGFT